MSLAQKLFLKQVFILGDRYSSVVSSAPTIMRLQVRIPTAPSTLFQFVMRKGRKNKKRPGFKKTSFQVFFLSSWKKERKKERVMKSGNEKKRGKLKPQKLTPQFLPQKLKLDKVQSKCLGYAWQSGWFRHQRSAVQIQVLASILVRYFCPFHKNNSNNWCLCSNKKVDFRIQTADLWCWEWPVQGSGSDTQHWAEWLI